MQQKPGKLQAVGALLIVSGVLQLPVSCLSQWIITAVVGTVAGALTFGIGACLGLVGFFSYLLIPLGMFEVVVGIITLTSKPNPMLLKVVAGLEIAGVFLGGLPGAIVGIANLVLTQDTEVAGYLANPETV